MKKQTLFPVLLPTEDASPIVIHKPSGELRLLPGFIKSNPAYEAQHLYLCSTLPIKEGDWVIGTLVNGGLFVGKVGYKFSDRCQINSHCPFDLYNCKKIEFTTDPKLFEVINKGIVGYKRGVPAIDGNTKAIYEYDYYKGSSQSFEKRKQEVNFLEEFVSRYNQKGYMDVSGNPLKNGASGLSTDFKRYNQKDKSSTIGYGKWKDSGKMKGVDVEKLREAVLDIYIKTHHTQEECIGFIDGFNASQSLPILQSKSGGFSLEDIKAIVKKYDTYNLCNKNCIDDFFEEELLPSLTKSQPKGDIIIELNNGILTFK